MKLENAPFCLATWLVLGITVVTKAQFTTFDPNGGPTSDSPFGQTGDKQALAANDEDSFLISRQLGYDYVTAWSFTVCFRFVEVIRGKSEIFLGIFKGNATEDLNNTDILLKMGSLNSFDALEVQEMTLFNTVHVMQPVGWLASVWHHICVRVTQDDGTGDMQGPPPQDSTDQPYTNETFTDSQSTNNTKPPLISSSVQVFSDGEMVYHSRLDQRVGITPAETTVNIARKVKEGGITDVSMWPVRFTDAEVQAWTNCQDTQHEFGLIWDRDIVPYEQISFQTLPEDTVCKIPAKPTFYTDAAQAAVTVMGTKFNYNTGKETCEKMNGAMATLDPESYGRIKIDDSSTHQVWTGYTDLAEEGVYRDAAGRLLEDPQWAEGEPDGGVLQNCVVLDLREMKLRDHNCTLQTYAICNFTQRLPSVQFRGEIRDVSDDLFLYQPNGNYYLSTDGRKTIKYSSGDSRWTLYRNDKLEAYASEGEDTMALGKITWQRTYKGEQVSMAGILHACSASDYVCTNGTCINGTSRCDGIVDCMGEEDETGCMQTKWVAYNSLLPPRGKEGKPIMVNITTKVLSILGINLANKDFTIKCLYLLSWHDHRITYLNLRDSDEDNQLNYDKWSSMWTPNMIFLNTRQSELESWQTGYRDSKVWVSKLADSAPLDETDITQDLDYPGDVNVLYKQSEYTLVFICEFDFDLYPFDKQFCSVNTTIFNSASKKVVLNSLGVTMLGKNSILDSVVYDWDTEVIYDPALFKEVLLIKFTIERRLSPIVLNTFLPNLVLTAINQLANYFLGPDQFDVVIGLTSTVIMTLAAMFISTLSSLPSSTSVRLIDIWLMTIFIYPFVIMLMHTIAQVIRRVRPKSGRKMIHWILFFVRIVLPLLFVVFVLGFFCYGLAARDEVARKAS